MKNLIIFSIASIFLSCSEAAKKQCIDKTKISSEAMCKDDYAPVCGCDGKIYSNACRAKNAGVTSWNDGECSKK
jgi:hypothetical protein